MTTTILEGNVLETLKEIAACTVQCVVTSPPYYGLRDYGMAGQIGLEPTPEAYVEKLVTVFREVHRVLKDDGTLWLNLGDGYWGGKGKSGYELPEEAEARRARGETIQKARNVPGYREMRPTDGKHLIIKPKDLIGIPWMVAFALRADGWYLRQEIIWAKPNPMPESVTDRCTKAHEHIFLLTKSRRYYFDQQAIKEPAVEANWQSRYERVSKKSAPGSLRNGLRNRSQTFKRQHSSRPEHLVPGQKYNPHRADRAESEYDLSTRNKRSVWFVEEDEYQQYMACKEQHGGNRLDVWQVATRPYAEAHFATYLPDLVETCLLAGSREGDTVLDFFCGSGTTLEVALKHNRHAIGCELNPEYLPLIRRRLAKVQPYLPQST